MFIDSHCHLDRLNFTPEYPDLQTVISDAQARGVSRFLAVAINMASIEPLKQLAHQYDCIDYSVGVHPLEQDIIEPTEQEIVQHAQASRVVAVGETGLDYYYCKGDLNWQKQRFSAHIRAANAVSKPLIVHTRDARKDTIKLLKAERAEQVGGVLHCFTEDIAMAEEAMALNFYISFSGIVSFKNAQALREVVKQVPLSRILIETDSPYLSPVPHRGKPCVPGFVIDVARVIAEIKDISLEDVASQTTKNYNSLFGAG